MCPQVLLVDLAVPCSVHFQRADALGLNSLYVPPKTLWTPGSKIQSSTMARRLLTRSQRHLQASTLAWKGERKHVESTRLPRTNVLEGEVGEPSTVSRRQPLRSELQNMLIQNSVLCITAGSSIVWEMKDGVYPVYLEVCQCSLIEGSCTIAL